MALFFLEFIVIASFPSLNKANAQITTLQAELHTTIDVPCHCVICPKSTSTVQWYLSSNPDVFVKSGTAVAWWTDEETGSNEGYRFNGDFSMKIYNITLQHNNKLFRCLAAPADGSQDCTSDVKLDIYAEPDGAPAIDYILHRDHGGFDVTCSISNVFPMTFPILRSEEGNGTKGYLNNGDGTFNTHVTNYFSAVEVNTTIECMYSIRKFKSKSSLRIVDYGDISGRDGEGDCMDKNATGSNFRSRRPGLWLLWTTLMMGVIF